MEQNQTKVRFFNPGLGYQKYKEQFDSEIQRVLASGDLILREDVEKFEKTLAEFCGTKYAVGLNSGTDALYLALVAAGIKPGDEILVPSHTFVATAQVVQQLGAVPVLYDMDGPKTKRLKTKALMVAHIAGEMFDFSTLPAIFRDLPIIEDACQSLGAVQDGKKAGSIGLAGAFSFYPAKILGAYGDAGALVTNDENIYNEVVELRNHYKKDYSKWGINSRLDNLQAAILNVKIQRLEETLQKRAMIAARYQSALKGLPLERPADVTGRVWQDYIIRTTKRDELYAFLKAKGIETMKNEYPFPIEKGEQSLQYEAETLRLPINELLINSEIDYVIEKVTEFFVD